MNPAYGGGVGVGGGGGAQGAVVPAAGTAPPQPMMRPPSSGPGYGMPPKQQQPLPPPQQQQQQRGFAPGPTGYVPTAGPPAAPAMMPPGVLGVAPAGLPRYSAPPYTAQVRPPVYPPRPTPGPAPVPIVLPRPPGTGLRPVPPVLKPPPGMILSDLAGKGMGQLAPPPEKPHTTVYVGKIAPTIEDEFLRAILELCGQIKSWKRAQDPTTGSPKGFGFCEFESAEGVLRALRLINKFSLEGQDLVLNVNQATREYLERYVLKKKEREKLALEEEAAIRKEERAPGVDAVVEPIKPAITIDDKDDNSSPEVDAKKFGLVTEADKEVDDNALQKLNAMLAERARSRPLPPPPPLPTVSDSAVKITSVSDVSALGRGANSAGDGAKSGDIVEETSVRNDDDAASDQKQASVDLEVISADRGKRGDRDRERDLEVEKERELERYERERERERIRRDRERENRLREAERLYEEREREWENREREKERQRLHDKEREKECERDRRREIKEQEEESDEDDWHKHRHGGSVQEERRKRRQREREDDAADRAREAEEEVLLAELAKRQKPTSDHALVANDTNDVVTEKEAVAISIVKPSNNAPATVFEPMSMFGSDSDEEPPQKVIASNGVHKSRDEEVITAMDIDPKPNNNNSAPRKLGFGLMGSGRRATVPSVFNHEDEEEAPDLNKIRPLVPIDYSAEEMQVVALPSSSVPVVPPSRGIASNLAAATEFVKSLALMPTAKADGDRERSRRSREKSGEREKTRRDKDRDKEKDRDRDAKRVTETEPKAPGAKKIVDAKQLIDTIPKTKEELFGYPVDWLIYDKHELHEKMRPWISKKITEFLGEEETTLVDFIEKLILQGAVRSLRNLGNMSRRFHILQGIFHSKIHLSKILMISDDLCAAEFLVLHCWTRIRAAEWEVRMECPYFEKVTFISKMKMIPLSLEDGGTNEQVAGGVEGFPGIGGICGTWHQTGTFLSLRW